MQPPRRAPPPPPPPLPPTPARRATRSHSGITENVAQLDMDIRVAYPDRSALMADIRKGARLIPLDKSQIKDRSQPAICLKDQDQLMKQSQASCPQLSPAPVNSDQRRPRSAPLPPVRNTPSPSTSSIGSPTPTYMPRRSLESRSNSAMRTRSPAAQRTLSPSRANYAPIANLYPMAARKSGMVIGNSQNTSGSTSTLVNSNGANSQGKPALPTAARATKRQAPSPPNPINRSPSPNVAYFRKTDETKTSTAEGVKNGTYANHIRSPSVPATVNRQAYSFSSTDGSSCQNGSMIAAQRKLLKTEWSVHEKSTSHSMFPISGHGKNAAPPPPTFPAHRQKMTHFQEAVNEIFAGPVSGVQKGGDSNGDRAEKVDYSSRKLIDNCRNPPRLQSAISKQAAVGTREILLTHAEFEGRFSFRVELPVPDDFVGLPKTYPSLAHTNYRNQIRYPR